MWRSLLFGVLLLGLGTPAQAKSYHLNRADVVARLGTDGSMHVQEIREVVFDGTFHAFDRTIPIPPGARIANLSIHEYDTVYLERTGEAPGTYTALNTGRDLVLSWFYTATDETRTFVVEYDVVGAVQKHADVAELYWKFIEPDHDWKARTSTVTVFLPTALPAGQVKAWAHGPLHGNVSILTDRVELTCNPLPANTMVEARILLPPTAFASTLREDSQEALPDVLIEEAAGAEQANRQRIVARAGVFLPLGTAAGGFLVMFALYSRYGREYREPNPPIYAREPLEGWKPTDVSYLWSWGTLGANDMTAMLMDLVRRGALRLTIRKEAHPILGGLLGVRTVDEQYLERVASFQGDLSPAEIYLMDRVLFGGVSGEASISIKELSERAKESPTAAKARFDHWKDLAKAESEKVPLVEPDSNVAMGFGIAVGVLVFSSTFLFGATLQTPTPMACGFGGFGIIISSLSIRSRTQEAAKALHYWQAFRRYLADFSRLREYPAPAVVLWEQYLVFAIALGVADRVIEQFKDLYPRLPEQERATFSAFPNWSTPEGPAFGDLDSISKAFTSFSSTVSVATSSFSSGSGGGGGFSGGGGGGGGGGSSGAR